MYSVFEMKTLSRAFSPLPCKQRVHTQRNVSISSHKRLRVNVALDCSTVCSTVDVHVPRISTVEAQSAYDTYSIDAPPTPSLVQMWVHIG